MRFPFRSLQTRQAGFAAALLLSLPLSAQVANRITQSVSTSPRVKIPGSTSVALRGATDLGLADSGLAFQKMMLVLQPSDQQKQDLNTLVAAQNDPSSAQYRKWLQPEDFAARFAPSAADIVQVRAWLEARGFTIDAVAKSGLWIQFSGTAGQVSTAFQTEIHRYQVAGQERIANASDISLPSALAPVVAGLSSLNNIPRHPMHTPMRHVSLNAAGHLSPDGKQADGTPAPEFTSGSGTHYLTPADLSTIYNINPLTSNGINGTGITIAIIGESDVQLADIQSFRQIFGLPANDPEIVMVGPDPGVSTGDEGESDLDLEYVGAFAPSAHIKFVEAGSTNATAGIDLAAAYAVDNLVAPIVSLSYGGCEAYVGNAGNVFYSSLWGQAAAQGMTVFVSSGDSGSAGCDPADKGVGATRGLQVNGIASTPYNVAVGGTEFAESTAASGTFWNSTNSSTGGSAIGYIPEIAWNETCDAQTDPTGCSADGYYTVLYGGGGGKSSCLNFIYTNSDNLNCSVGYPKPDWQVGVGVPADGVRDLPDVSLSAAFQHDGYLVCTEGSCQTIYQNGKMILSQALIVGGTSASAPSMAGIMALVEQKNGQYQGQANYTFYKLAAAQNTSACNSSTMTNPGTNSGCVFHDVTVGTNTVPCQGQTNNCTSQIAYVDGTLTGYSTTAGYDQATGLGSVDGNNLVNAWSSVTLLPSTATLTTGQTTIAHGVAMPFNVTVAPGSGTGVPSGLVILSGNGKVTGPFTLAGGKYAGSTQQLAGGSYALKAHYAGSGVYTPSDSNTISITVTPEASAVTLKLYYDINGSLANVPTPVPYGGYLYMTSSVAGASGQGVPSGTLTFFMDGALLGQFPLDPSGSVNFFVQNYLANGTVPPGAHTFTATYSGDPSFNASSTAAGVAITVAKSVGYTLAFPNMNSVKAGQPVQIYYTVPNASSAALPPTGTMQLYDNGVALGPLQTLAQNGPEGAGIAQAEYTATSLAVGTHTFTASYSGDANYTAIPQGSGYQLKSTLTVSPATLTPSLAKISQSLASPSVGQSVAYTVQVSASATGGSTATPTGTVTLFNPNPGLYGSTIGSAALVNGVATITVPYYLAGPLELYASYPGDSNFDPSLSAVLLTTIQTIPPTAVTLMPNAAYTAPGQQSSLNFTVVGKPNVGSYPVPTGSVLFYDSLNGGAAQLIGNQTISLGNGEVGVTSLGIKLAFGSHVISAVYSGDSTWSAATVKTAVVVSTPDFAIASAAGTSVLPVGGSVSSTLTVTPLVNYAGTVSFACTSGVPVGINCAIVPSSVTLGGATTTTVTLTSAAAHAELITPSFFRKNHMQDAGVLLAGLGFAGIFLLRRRKKLIGVLSVLFLLTGLGIFTVGCASPVPSQYTVTLTSQNGTRAAQGSAVQLVASITGDVGGIVNSGGVTFYDGSTALGVSTVANGTTSFITSSLAVGVHTLTAVYTDTRAVNVTSNAVNQAVTGAFTVQITATSGALTHSTPLSFQLQ